MIPSVAPPQREPPTTRSPHDPDWRVWTAPASVALGLMLGVFGAIVVGVFGQATGSSLSHPSPAVNIVSDVVFDVGFVLSALYFAGIHGRPRPSDFGFRRTNVRFAATTVVVAGLGYYAITALYASILRLHGKDKLPSGLGADKSTAALVAAAVFVCVIAPIAEELYFRGFLFTVLRRWRGPWVAAVIVGVLFGLAHTGSASPQYLVPLALLGFVLCLVRWRTGSLYPCIALHSLNNSLALGINQLHWNALEIAGLMAASFAVVGAITAPLSREPEPS